MKKMNQGPLFEQAGVRGGTAKTQRTSDSRPATDPRPATDETDSLFALALEPRLLLDAAAVATGAETAETADTAETSGASPDGADAADPKRAGDEAAAAALSESDAEADTVVFVDTGVEGWQTLADGVDPDAQLVLVGPNEDGMRVMADTLAGRDDVQSVHVLGHGGVGSFTLGSASVDADTLESYASELGIIEAALTADADLLLYGCYVGADGAGTAFVDALADATAADVAASTDATGAADLGGDWTLEVATGDIHADHSLDSAALSDFSGVLALPPSDPYTSTPGSGYTGAGNITGFSPRTGTPGSATIDGSYFNISAEINGSPNGIYTVYGNIGYVVTYVSSYSIGDTMEWRITADAAGFASFELSGLSIGEYVDADIWNGRMIEGFLNGSSVATGSFSDPAGNAFTVDITNFSGVQIDEFRITASNGDPSTAANNFSLYSFETSNHQAPDTTPPTVDSIVRQSPTTATTDADTVTFRVDFSEDMDVSTVNTADFTLSGTAAGDGTVNSVAQVGGNPAQYDVEITGIASSNGTLNLDISGSSSLNDLAGNALTNTTVSGSDQTYTISNNTAPTVALANTTTSLAEDTSTVSRVKVADITITDDGNGTNTLSLTGADASLFEIDGTELFISAGETLDFETNPALDVTVQVDDTSVGATPDDTAALTINLTDVNEFTPTAPTDSDGTANSVAEDATVGATVGVTASSTDADGTDTPTYTLTNNAGGRFQIDTNTGAVTVAGALDHEANASHTITVQASDGTNTSTADFTVTVTDVNEAPAITGTAATPGINDDQTATPFSPLSFSDPEGNGGTITITYTGANGTLSGTGLSGSAGSYTLSGGTAVELTTRLQALVFTPTANQVAPTNTVNTTFTLTPNDGSLGGSANSDTQVTVTSVNDAPTDITLTSSSVNQSGGTDAVVGTLGAVDPDTSDTATFTLVSGSGDDDNGSFNISGTNLRANDAAALAAGSYSVRVRVTDSQAATFDEVFTITVVDDVAPAAPSTPDLATADDSGNDTDNETNVTTPTFTGTGETGETVTLFADANSNGTVDGGESLGTTTVAPGGTWSIDSSALTDGTYNIRAIQEDAANNTSTASAGLSVTIDATAPTAPTGTLSVDEDVTTAGQSVGTASASDANTFTYDLTDDGGGRFQIDPNTGAITTLGTPSFDHETEPSIDVTVRATDTAGNATSATLSVSVNDVNEAPTLGGTPTDETVDEDVTTAIDLSAYTLADPEGDSLTLTLAVNRGSIASVDGDGLTTGVTVSNSGTALMTLAGTTADLNSYLTDTSKITFTTGLNDTTAATLTVTPNDGALDGPSDTVTINVTPVNDAPTLTPATPSFTTIDENTTAHGGDQVSTLLGASVSDPDSGAVEGIAVTGMTSGNGTWEYSTNSGSSWTDVGTVADNNALLLTASDLLRFIPDGENGTSANVTYRAWDQTSGTEGTKVDTTTNGMATAFSTATDTASITVNSVNDAPTLTGGTVDLGTTDEDTTTGGTTVSSLLTGTGYADVDAGADSGIAVTVTTGNGTWEYSTDGSTWTGFGTVSTAAALLLDSGSQVRYVPDGQNGETATFNFVAWDQTSGTASTNGSPQTGNASSAGGTNAFSFGNGSTVLTVDDVNDAPVLTPAAPTFPTIDEDATGNAGQQVSTLLGTSVSDVDSGVDEGIAITGLNSGNGTWEYSLDGGASWTDVGTVTNSSALLLTASDFLRFRPNGETGTTADITYRAWDQSDGDEGNKVDTAPNGSTTEFSTATDTASITVTAVNDAPTVTAPTGPLNATEETSFAFTGANAISIADVDAGGSDLTLDISVTDGTLSFGTTTGLTALTNNAAAVSATGTVSELNAALASLTYTGDTNFAGNDTFILTVSDNGNTGTDPGTTGTPSDEEATEVITIQVANVNDAPTATGTISGTAFNDNAGAQAIFGNIVIGDVDAGENDLTVEIRLSNPSAGTIAGGGFTEVTAGVYRLTGQTPASATTALDSAAFTPANNTGPSGSFSTDFTIAVDDQSVPEVTHNAGTVTVTRVNDAPTIANVAGETTNITIGEGAQDVALLNDAAIADPDAANFAGGVLQIQQTSGTIDGEWLLDTNVAITSGGMFGPSTPNFFNSATVEVDLNGDGTFTTIGQVDGTNTGIAGDPLRITLNANATPERVEAFLGALEYTIATPTVVDTRDFDLTLSDGDGATSTTATFTLGAIPPGPEISAITSTTADGLYGVGDSVNVTVTLDTASDFTAGGGTLQATLSNGATVVLAGADATNQTSFSGTYTIQEGDGDVTDLNVTSVDLTGGATLIANGGIAPADLSVLPSGSNLADSEDIDVDANTPSVAVPDLTAATDTGISDTDNLTNNPTPTITGTTEAGASVTVRVGGSTIGSPVTADGSGTWSFTFAGGDLGEGANAVDIIASDAAGNTSADSADLTITLDTTAPTAAADAGAVNEGDPAGNLGGLNVRTNDTGTTAIANDPVTAVAGSAANLGTAVAGDNGGLFTVNADGTVSFDPNGDYDALAAGATATTTVAVTVRDDAGNTATADLTVTVTGVNDAPSFTGAASLAAVDEDAGDPPGAAVSSLFGGLVADVDGGASLAGIAVTGNAATAAEGTWQVQIGGTGWIDLPTVSDANALLLSGASQLRFVPAADYNGTPGALSVRAVDDSYGGAFSTAPGGSLTAVTQDVTGANSGGTTAFSGADTTLTTSITAVNDAPAITAPATASVAEDGTLALAGLSIADVDAGGGNLTVTLGVTDGVVTLGSLTGLTVSGDGTASITATGTLADLNAALAGLTYTPAADFNGADSLAITVDDGGNSGGAAETDSAAVAITVNAVNDAPTVANAPADQTATEDEAFEYQLPAETFDDVDAGDTLTLTAGLAGGGALPDWLSFDPATRTFSGTPAEDDTGTLSLAVTAADGDNETATASFDLTVEAGEDPVTPSVTTLDRGPVRVTVIETGGESVLIANSNVVSGRALDAILGTFERGNSPLAQSFRAATANLATDTSETLQNALGDAKTRQKVQEIADTGGETLIFQDGEWRPLDLDTVLQLSQATGAPVVDGGPGDLVQTPVEPSGTPVRTAAAPQGEIDAAAPKDDAETAAALAAARANAKAHWLDAAIAALAEAEPLEGTGALAALVPTDRLGETGGFSGQLRERASAFDRDAAALADSLAATAA